MTRQGKNTLDPPQDRKYIYFLKIKQINKIQSGFSKKLRIRLVKGIICNNKSNIKIFNFFSWVD